MPSFGPPAREKRLSQALATKGGISSVTEHQKRSSTKPVWPKDTSTALRELPCFRLANIELQPCQNASFNQPRYALNKRFYWPCPGQSERNEHSTPGRKHRLPAAELGSHPLRPRAYRTKDSSHSGLNFLFVCLHHRRESLLQMRKPAKDRLLQDSRRDERHLFAFERRGRARHRHSLQWKPWRRRRL